jgi:hypothetical protein
MTRRVRNILWQGAASALLVVGEPALAEPVDEVNSLPQWAVRAQQRLALDPAQQRELRALVDENTARLQALQGHHPDAHDMAELQREFRVGLAQILAPEQLAEWDSLLEELLGAVHLRNAPMLAERRH